MKRFILIFVSIILLLNLISCNGFFNIPLMKPYSPEPAINSADVSLNPELSWKCNDPDDGSVYYDIYFGITENPPLVEESYIGRIYHPNELEYSTKYYWKVVAKNDDGEVKEGPLWSFLTVNRSPSKPTNPDPSDGMENLELPYVFSWKCSDPDNDELTYDIYLGKEDPLPLVKTNHNSNTYEVTGLKSNTIYYWKIVAKDEHSAESTSDTWEFTTKNSPPLVPYDPSPSNGATNVSRSPSLSWKCSDPDGDDVTFDIYFGQNDLSLVRSDYKTLSYQITVTLEHGEHFYWKIIAKDNNGLTSESALWEFRTKNSPPSTPSNPYPVNGAKDLPVDITCDWSSNDKENDSIYYDFYLGMDENLSPIATNLTENSKSLNDLEYETQYYWKVFAVDEKGDRSEGPVWSFNTQTKPPEIVFSKCFGGSKTEKLECIEKTNDGGYILAGQSDSVDGDITDNHGSYDSWVVKLDDKGEIQWQKSFGGLVNGTARSIQQTNDGGYIVAASGYTLIKLDDKGEIQWQKSFGGSGNDQAQNIQQTNDGGYIVAGYSSSNDGDVTGNHGSYDYWVVKLDDKREIQWQKSFGGSEWDIAYSIQQTNDGGYIVAGYTESNDGDVTGNHGKRDFWVIKLDGMLNIMWQKCFGGSNEDVASDVQQTNDGGYIVAGYTESNDGDVTGNHGDYDFWVIKLDVYGNILWQKCFGGSKRDLAESIIQTPNGEYVVIGSTESSDGDISTIHGVRFDFWVLKLDGEGKILWQKCFGGTNRDVARDIQQTNDGGYIVAGNSSSNDGDVIGNHGFSDYWVVKLEAE